VSNLDEELPEAHLHSWNPSQKSLYEWIKVDSNNNIIVQDLRGTFADNMKASIHRWFRYPAGFSYSLVEEAFKKYIVSKSCIVLDPFVGVGTTCVCAKKYGIPSIGVEAHPLIAWIARVKTYWDFDFKYLKKYVNQILFEINRVIEGSKDIDVTNKPPLLQKCFDKEKLSQLYALKNYSEKISDERVRDIFILALLSTLRRVSKAHTGWPYILPKKERKKVPDVLQTFQSQLKMMISDLEAVVTEDNKKTPADIIMDDARRLSCFIDKEIDFAFTSPPYLNNYDYADRTRLELYFLSPFKIDGEIINTSSWSDLTRQIRSKLIVNVSHQAVELGLPEGLLPSFEIPEHIREKLIDISERLRREKALHGGHKDYDIMVVAYFNDMFETLKEVYKVMKPDAYYLLVLGDSAPYGVHVPTDVLLAQIALGIGFSSAKIGLLRTRGEKWKSAPKHRVPLRESMVILQK
jgi:hypothetical protein